MPLFNKLKQIPVTRWEAHLACALWYGLRVKSRHEKSASTILREKGFDEFAALYRSKRKWSDRIATVELPLFPGYIFCRFALPQRISVRRIPGIVAIVSLAGEPVPIPEEQIDAVRRVAYSGLDTELSPYLYTGQSVYVIGGPLEGTRGIYIRSKKDGCLVINVDLLQRSVSVSLHPSLVKPS